MSDDIKFVGEVPQDPRIQEALDKYQNSNQDDITRALTPKPVVGLEKYGITLRKPSLAHSAILTRIISNKREVAVEYQPFIYIWSLAAPLHEVYEGIETLERSGLPRFMADVHSWFDKSGIPAEVSNDVLQAISETFEIAGKLSGVNTSGDEEAEGLKKNALPGSQSQPTE